MYDRAQDPGMKSLQRAGKIIYPSQKVLRASFLDYCVAYRQGFQNILGLYIYYLEMSRCQKYGRQRKTKISQKMPIFTTIFSVPLPKLGR